jgi:hypothetical protein
VNLQAADITDLAPQVDDHLFDGEAAMGVLRTHPRIHINGIIVPNSRCIPTRQFLGTP